MPGSPSWPESEAAGPDLAAYAWEDLREAPEPPRGEERLSGAGAFGGEKRSWAQAFDPGRPGVRALAAVAVVVVLVAGFLAWRSRPRVDDVDIPVPPAFASSPPEAGVEPAQPGTGSVAAGSGAAAEVVVAVGGKVRKPGLVRLPPGARVADAIAGAGGAEPGVDVAALNLARKVTDGELIMVGVTPPPGTVTVPGVHPPSGSGGPLNLNTADLGDLDALPGVGPVLAQRILDARDAQGGFTSVADLRKVDGIGDARYEQLKELVTVG
ncbi:ComEA family DNA-binding protein [Actinoplanes sp. CA-015351]|uniref:ComEA family DNA-binding protein n=1 Tax=Actinoplanes sp. CA-015351 TaxID=3239897 RepID=UPI003D988079